VLLLFCDWSNAVATGIAGISNSLRGYTGTYGIISRKTASKLSIAIERTGRSIAIPSSFLVPGVRKTGNAKLSRRFRRFIYII